MKKILIIEDDPVMNRMVSKMFRYQGYEVRVAHDGEEGLKLAEEFEPNLILLDVMMPKINGLEVLKQLKNDSKLKSIKVVLLTNLGLESALQEARDLGTVAIITKSDHDPYQLVEMVQRVIED